MLKSIKQTQVKVLAIAVSMAVLPFVSPASHAAGLGRITVQSALGQPLRAQLEVTATRDELNSLSARLASVDAFRLAGVEYAPALSTLRFAKTVKEEGGRKFIEVSTERPLNEPFIDMLVELNWTAGRLVREYTFLLDPPELMAKTAPVAPPTASSPAPATIAPEPQAQGRAVETAPNAAPVIAKPAVLSAPAATKRPHTPAKIDAVASPSPSGSDEATRTVKSGDTLGKIAQAVRPEGVSLDQMLVALFRENQDAFDGNMNRLRVGKIIKVPEAAAIAAIDTTEARKEVVAQSRDFESYRARLAEKAGAAPGKDSNAAQESQGKVAPKVEAPVAPAKAGGDKLSVSKSESGKDAAKDGNKDSAGKAKLGALEEDLVARDRALKEANTRIADLEKNLNDLKKLAEMKSQAAAQKAGEQAKPAQPVKPAEPPKVAEPVKVAEPTKPAEPELAAKPVPQVTPAPESKPEAPAVVAAAPAAVPKPAEKKPSPVVVADDDEEEAGFIEENAPLVFGGGSLLALLAGYLGFSAVRRKRKATANTDDQSLTQSGPAENSVFDETASSSMAASTVAVAGEPSIVDTAADGGAAIIDPIEEADTYLAFGKDSQAEEILLEALRADPGRLAVHLKLLEIYAGRRSTMQFNTLAEDLRQQTGASGEEWNRAVEMGRVLDPNNPLYLDAPPVAVAENEEAATEPLDTEATMVFSAPPAMAEPVADAAPEEPVAVDTSAGLDFDLGLDEPASPEAEVAPAVEVASDTEVAALDFDLDLGDSTSSPAIDLGEPEGDDVGASVETQAAPAVDVAAAASLPAMDIDFDLELPDSAAPAAEPLTLDVDLGAPDTPAPVEVNLLAPDELSLELPAGEVPDAVPAVDLVLDTPAPELPTESKDTGAGLDFDFDLGDSAVTAPDAPAAVAEPVADVAAVLEAPALDLDLDLDLGAGEVAPSEPAGATAGDNDVPDNPEAATKIELALAYEEMGDRDGARELFQEVLTEGSPAQQATARSKLEQLG